MPALVAPLVQRLFLSAGAEAEGVAFHRHEATWAALLAGEKTWFVTRSLPDRMQHRHQPRERLERRKGLARCTQRPSELVFLPAQTWHATYHRGPWSLALGGQGVAAPGVHDAMTGPAVPAGLRDLAEPLRAAAQAGRVDVVEELLDRGAAAHGALAAAAGAGHEGTLRLLARRGADLEATTGGAQFRALHEAAHHGHAAVRAG